MVFTFVANIFAVAHSRYSFQILSVILLARMMSKLIGKKIKLVELGCVRGLRD